MDIQIVDADVRDALVLRNLMQLYVYDFSEYLDVDVQDNGRFEERPSDAYWLEAGRRTFLIKADGRLAGFALVQQRSRLSDETDVWDMAEFFVLRRYRKQGIGARVATQLFDRFRGRWEVRQRAQNRDAAAFWRAVIDRYTRGQFTEVDWDDGRWSGPVQFFTSAHRPPP